MKRKDLYVEIPHLTVSTTIRIRFNEVDSLGIVWHGHYITYFEDGREAFGREHKLSYLEIKKSGFTTPIVKSTCEHKLSLRYGDVVRIETTLVDTPAAKLIYRYKIIDQREQVICTGETVQVFLDAEGNLLLNTPEFFIAWKTSLGL